MRRVLTAVLVVGFLAGPAPAAVGASHDVAIAGVYSGFNPSTLTVALGDTDLWTNADTIQHTSTQSVGAALWDSGRLTAGQTFSLTLTAAGTYPYHCNIHLSMDGVVSVPVLASLMPTGRIKVIVASVAPEDGFVFDVQRRDGKGRWHLWKEGVTGRSVKFSPPSDGAYAFRSRLRRESGESSAWSPAASVTI
jgi:plastocyanin